MHRCLESPILVSGMAAGSGLVRLAEAQEIAEGGIAVTYGIDEGPRGEKKTDFDIRLRSPNATGSFHVLGPSISSTDRATITSEGWSWSISVAADLPNPSTSDNSDGFYTGGKLVFNSPFSAENVSSSSSDPVDDDWTVCIYQWNMWETAYPASLRTDNGTCLSVLSSECIAAIEQEAASKHTSENCRCPTAREIPECAELGDDSALWSSGCGANWFNSSAVRAWGDRGLDRRTFGGPAHERGNTTAYDYIGSLAWPVMASFSNFQTGGLVTAKLSCPRADTATEGSVVPSAEGLDAGDDGQGQDSGDDQDGEEDGGGRTSANWLVLGGLLIVSMLTV